MPVWSAFRACGHDVVEFFKRTEWAFLIKLNRPAMGAIQRLNLALFVGAQHQRMLRRVEVETDNVFQFLGERRIVAGLEGLHAMRFQAFGIDSVDVVTFSSGIYDTNQFIAVGGKGLNFQGACNQDPAGGTEISRAVQARRQYLSGMTTGGPRPGFEYLPLDRWLNEPNRKTMFPNDAFNYLHTWCIPMYTLYLAMQGP
jgi:hypothetical protein